MVRRFVVIGKQGLRGSTPGAGVNMGMGYLQR
jgi:hypothetical protein